MSIVGKLGLLNDHCITLKNVVNLLLGDYSKCYDVKYNFIYNEELLNILISFQNNIFLSFFI